MSEIERGTPTVSPGGGVSPSAQWYLPGFSPLQLPGGSLSALEAQQEYSRGVNLMRELSRQSESASDLFGDVASEFASALARCEALAAGFSELPRSVDLGPSGSFNGL